VLQECCKCVTRVYDQFADVVLNRGPGEQDGVFGLDLRQMPVASRRHLVC
jgi:hypothetical protein